MSFVALPLDALLAAQGEWIERIRLCYGTDRLRFEQEVLRMIRGLAAYVHQLPASHNEAFREPGGLLQLSLQTAFYSLQGSDGQIFSGKASLVARRHLEPRWRLATLIAGLCAETHRPLGQMRVSSASGAHWPAALQPLLLWLEQHNTSHYEVDWLPNRLPQQGLTLFTLPHLLPADLLQYLADDNSVVISHLLASLSGVSMHGETNVIDTLVRRAQTLVIEREHAAHAGRHGVSLEGTHLQQALMQALHQLCSRHPAWQPNAPKSRIWWGADGVFLLWPAAAPELHQQLTALLTPGLPVCAAALLPLLLKSAAVHVHPEAHGLWTISPPGQASTFTALKLVDSPHLLDLLPADRKPLNQNLVFATSPAASPPQLVLPLESEAPLTAPAPQPENPAPLTLNAPLRLNPVVQQAVANTLHSSQVYPIAEGLFVPLHALESQGIKAATAIRALNELSMLIRSAQHEAPTHSREVDGHAITGVIIDPRYIAGLPPKPVAEAVA